LDNCFSSMLTSHQRRCVLCRVYFTAQASHLEHLARKFEESVDKAMGLALPQRHKLQAAALAKRFPVAEMMQQYADAWVQVCGCTTDTLPQIALICPPAGTRAHEAAASQQLHGPIVRKTGVHAWRKHEERQRASLDWLLSCTHNLHMLLSTVRAMFCLLCMQVGSSHTKVQASRGAVHRRMARQTSFFADSWSRCNQQAPASTAPAVSSTLAPASSIGATSVFPSASSSNCDGCTICIINQGSVKCCEMAAADTGAESSSKQHVSNILMVVLQPLSLGPGILLLSFLLLHEVMVGSKHTVGLRLQDVVFGRLPQYISMTGPLVMAFLILSTGETLCQTARLGWLLVSTACNSACSQPVL
jgi:hypothetical protein